MKNYFSSRFLAGILITCLSALLITPVAMAGDTEHETQCFNEIQGKIPWNEDKNMNWKPENVKQLCKGTSKPTQPGECFLAVNSGEVKWGKGSKAGEWEWKNVINLCSGTDDAKKTVDCFNGATSKGQDWRDAILFCQRGHDNKVE
jgi:hypothetical protein